MNETQLSKRLLAVANYVKAGSRIADIGSDHGYLPVYLVKQGKIPFAIAGEVVPGPFQSAQQQVAKNHLETAIDVRLGDGLDVVTLADQLTAITICGMGGALITTILDNGFKADRLSGQERLILQPNIGEEGLRRWLVQHDYLLIAEEILEEDEKIYEILVAEKAACAPNYRPQELMFGPFLLKAKTPVFRKKWQRELQQYQHVLTQLEAAKTDQEQRKARLQRQIKWLQEVLQENDEG